MSHDEEQQRRSRIVVETPTARREVVQTQTTRVPEERKGFSTGIVAAVAIAAVALTALLFLFLSNNKDDSNMNINVATAPTPLPTVAAPTYVPPPTTTVPPTTTYVPPTVTTTQPAPIIVTAPPTTTQPTTPAANTAATPAPGTDDLSLTQSIRSKLLDDRELGTTDVVVSVQNGVATLTGSVQTNGLKARASQLARVRGIRTIDNQITVAGGMEPNTTPPN